MSLIYYLSVCLTGFSVLDVPLACGKRLQSYDAVWASADRAGLTPWESFVRGAFGYSLLDRGNASAGVRAGRFLATSLEPVVGGLEWVPRPYVRRA